MPPKHRRLAVAVLAFFFLLLLALLARFLWHRHLYAVTNAVFVETDSLALVSFDQVGGRIRKLLKEEGEPVSAGELLAALDETTYALKAKTLEENLGALKRKAEALRIEIRRLTREIALREAQAGHEIERLSAEREAVEGERAALSAQLSQAERDRQRFERLWREGLVARHRFEEVATQAATLRERYRALTARRAALAAAIRAAEKEKARARNQRKLIQEKKKELAALEARIRAQEKALAEARVLLSYCKLKSPTSGYIAKRFHTVGDVVGPGEPVYAVVDFSKLYILVLLEENKLRGVKPGCEARIRIDAYPGKEFRGVVTAVLPATAAKFALVPRDISAGEFTKVAQRVPVKIRLTQGPVELLRVGLGGEVEIRRDL
ncbi:HlyD family efflux transporter periplasmic adaptor subunit [Thermosulfurimonas marina]|uniref:HlyD family efflux transporter periplasmic adaptor subunit n=1 Tax=Thermosulfurimonas marina TaxID=2047767 RepID=A0A6H1WRZ8_9BACT|nr:HlyD family secretion protein [Thermosulfurimonas marina]QJA05997.1 HlyD family efflux transporter periplasmic adaptor subunit [Thermosulfurimonas marina]